MIILTIISIFLNSIFIIFCLFERTKNKDLKAEIRQLRTKKVVTSAQVIQSFEKAMIKAIDAGDITQYKKYKNLYNDLIPPVRKSADKVIR